MRSLLVNCKLTEVNVNGHENAVFALGAGQQLSVARIRPNVGGVQGVMPLLD